MGSWFPQSPGLPATVLCGILARGPALTVFDRKASSWSVAGGRPWGEPLDGLQLSATSPRCPEGWLGGETPAFNLRADDWPIGLECADVWKCGEVIARAVSVAGSLCPPSVSTMCLRAATRLCWARGAACAVSGVWNECRAAACRSTGWAHSRACGTQLVTRCKWRGRGSTAGARPAVM